MRFKFTKLFLAALSGVFFCTQVEAQSCSINFYSNAFAKMTSPEHEDALQDTVVRFLEKGTFEDLNAKNFDNPLSYLLMSERNQYRSNFRKGGGWRYHNYDQDDLNALNDKFYGEENITCTATEHYVDRMIEGLDQESGEILSLLLQGYKKSEIEEEMGLYRGRAGRVLRQKIIPYAEHLSEEY